MFPSQLNKIDSVKSDLTSSQLPPASPSFNHTTQSDVMKFVIHSDKFLSYTNNYKSSVLLLAQGFGLVMPDSFSLCELGRVWA